VRKKLTVLVAMALMLAMMLASTGTASAVAIANGKGGEKANANASFGIGMAVTYPSKYKRIRVALPRSDHRGSHAPIRTDEGFGIAAPARRAQFI
jgi:hypothetical protein